MSLPLKSLPTVAPARKADRLGIFARLGLALAAGMLAAVPVAAFGPEPFFGGWAAAALLLSGSFFFLLSAWQWSGGGRLLAWMLALAFFLRLITGIGLSLALPHWGYAEPEQQAGYLFKDANYRDEEAWKLAVSGRPLGETFRDEFATDQYGGLLALSALVYRYLSPDVHRPFLILILGAFFTALGVPFLYLAARQYWSKRVAALACWIYVLYPDAIFFGSSQMREPFLVGLSAVAFWSVLSWKEHRLQSLLAFTGAALGMALISSRVAAAAIGFLGLLFLLQYVVGLPGRRWKIAGWLVLAVGLLFMLFYSWEWFRSSSGYDALLTWRNSGQVSVRIQELGEEWALPFIVGYGIARPVLPAAIAETKSIPLWKTIIIVRSAGWYALAPFLVYAFFTFRREALGPKRRLVFWLVVVVFLWLAIAAARGGGDAVDNPRYRSLFIVWMALLAAWSVDWALAHRDAWLWRWVGVECVFLAFFTYWYVGRYYRLWVWMPFWSMVLWIVGLSGLLLVGGWFWDRRKTGQSRLPFTRKKDGDGSVPRE